MSSSEQPEPYAIGVREQKGTEVLSLQILGYQNHQSQDWYLTPDLCDLLKVPKSHHDKPL